MTPKLTELISRCKCGIHFKVNGHRDVYEMVGVYLRDIQERHEIDSLAEPEVILKMIETNTVVELQFYPATPNGFYCVWHYDIGQAIDEALAILDEQDISEHRSRKA